MRFRLDVGLARSTSRRLTVLGHDAVHLRDLGLQRLSDLQIIDKARVESRIILTHDLDFGRIVALGRAQLPSVITFRLQDMRPRHVDQQLDHVIARFEGQLLAGALVSVTDESIRVRKLPVE